MIGWGRDRVSGLTAPGERVLWSGRPAPRGRPRGKDVARSLFGLAWLAFAAFWSWNVWLQGEMWVALPFGAGAAFVGLWLLILKPMRDRRRRAATEYVVTDNRVIVARGGSRVHVRSLPVDRLPELTLIGNPDGSGTIRFERPRPREPIPPGTMGRTDDYLRERALRRRVRARGPAPLAFEDVEDAAAVYAIIADAARRTAD